MSRHRSWCFTLNNYTPNECLVIEAAAGNPRVKYIVVGMEVGEKGTPHLQGYIAMHNGCAMKSMKKLLGDRCHLIVAAGTASENRVYCTKEKLWLEMGEVPQQGHRSDIEFARELVKKGATNLELLDNVGFQAARHGMLMKANGAGPKRFWEMEVIWHCGPTGCGKTRAAWENCGKESTWMTAKNLRWWDGYDGHENVIVDDFRGDFCTFHELLRILDRYPYRVEVKGGSQELLATKIYITSPKCWRCAYAQRCTEDLNQLGRRITREIGSCVECNGVTQRSGVIVDPRPVVHLEIENKSCAPVKGGDSEQFEIKDIEDFLVGGSWGVGCAENDEFHKSPSATV